MRLLEVHVLLCLAFAGCAASPSAIPVGVGVDQLRETLDTFPERSAGRAWAGDAYIVGAGCAPGGCPPVARLRPTEGWAYRDALHCASPRDAYCERVRNKRSLLVGTAAIGGILGYGLIFWDYGSGEFGVVDEGWFGKSTSHGGADKTGHFVSGAMWTAGMSALHRSWGFSRRESAIRGATIGFATLAALEVADGTSERQGFSYSDLVADAAGCLAGYFHETSPWVNRVLDLRAEWFPTQDPVTGTDLTSDYENSSHLLAVNVGGLLSRRPSHWDLLDLQLGYRTRGYDANDRDPERWVFVGAGLNVANLLRRIGFRHAAVFEHLQLPFVSVRIGFEIGDGETQVLWRP